MKTMKCRELGGACDEEFRAETFEEIAELSKNHGMQMRNDTAHQRAMDAMRELMADPEAMQSWLRKKREAFETLTDE